MFEEINDELEEAEAEFKKWDYWELEQELWDVFRDFVLLWYKLEQEWKISVDKIYESIYKKMMRRKPYLEDGRQVSEEEAIDVWNKAKRAEWYSEDRLRNEERTRCY